MTTDKNHHSDVFLSHNSEDKPYAKSLATALQLVGCQVWLAAWKIRPGDSILGTVNEGLEQFDIFLLVWSSSAAASRWVEFEVNSALTRAIHNPSCKFIPVILDDTPLPPIIQDIAYSDARDERAPILVVKDILGIETDSDLRIAVQHAIEEIGLDIREFEGAGVFACCPKCGAEVKHLRGREWTDYERDRMYVGVECQQCGWQEGSDV